LAALERGIPTFVIEEVPIEKRDFTKGKAKALLTKLKSEGAEFVKDQNELLSMLNVSIDKLKIAKEERDRILDHLKPEKITEKTETNGAGDKS
jgi:hypothetical protein